MSNLRKNDQFTNLPASLKPNKGAGLATGYNDSSDLLSLSTLATPLLTRAISARKQIKLSITITAIELGTIRPLIVDALMDELEARIREGSFF
jgi:hypothetical protein